MSELLFAIDVPVYSGPIDLLLHIVRHKQLDLTELPLAEIAGDFLQYARNTENLDLDDAGEVVFVASLLLSMKARALLPGEEEELDLPEEDDLGMISEELEETYRQIVAAAQELSRNEQEQRSHFPRGEAVAAPQLNEGEELLQDVTLVQLAEVFRDLTRSMDKRNFRQISLLKVSVRDQAELITQMLKKKEKIRFRELVKNIADRIEAVVAFLALLQMIRRGRIVVKQRKFLGEIFIHRGPKYSLNVDDIQED